MGCVSRSPASGSSLSGMQLAGQWSGRRTPQLRAGSTATMLFLVARLSNTDHYGDSCTMQATTTLDARRNGNDKAQWYSKQLTPHSSRFSRLEDQKSCENWSQL
ncbi:hypothetical protein EDC01DRAFT_631820 [Geopyxis carbonaria]|nr:hypothetical protein EDC01DRAFT_631820 [Geopyxis carbonaria]